MVQTRRQQAGGKASGRGPPAAATTRPVGATTRSTSVKTGKVSSGPPAAAATIIRSRRVTCGTAATTGKEPYGSPAAATTRSGRATRGTSTTAGKEPLGSREAAPSSKKEGGQVPFATRLAQLKQYKTNHGDLLVPDKYKVNGLGAWVRNARYDMKKGGFDRKHAQELDLLGFVWEVKARPSFQLDGDKFEHNFQRLVGFKQKVGHCNVPLKGDDADRPLYNWISRQKTDYKKMNERKKEGKTKSGDGVIEERMKRLEGIGFIFDKRAHEWNSSYCRLLKYKDEYRDCDVPDDYEDDPTLGVWVRCQRTQYHRLKDGKDSSMTQERIDQLESVGFSWQIRATKKQVAAKKAADAEKKKDRQY